MQYPIFDFPFYHEDIDLKRIYPIGSIIIRSSPLADKVEWDYDEIDPNDKILKVEWEGMTWKYITNWQSTAAEYYSDEFILRQNIAYLHHHPAPLTNKYNAEILTNDTFNGENKHLLTVNEMPSHNHGVYYRGWLNCDNGSSKQCLARDWISGDQRTYMVCENKGGGQKHNNQELGKRVYIYERIA